MINTRVSPWRFIHTNRITALSNVAYLWDTQTLLTFLKTHLKSSLLESSLNHFEPFWRFKLSQWWVFWILSPNSVTVTCSFTVAINSKNASNFGYIHAPLNTIPIFTSSSPFIYIYIYFLFFSTFSLLIWILLLILFCKKKKKKKPVWALRIAQSN